MWRQLRRSPALLALGIVVAWGCEGDDGESPLLACPAIEGAASDPCCTPCDVTEGEECSSSGRSFPNEARTREEWEGTGDARVVAGVCSEGPRFVAMGNGFFSEMRFFDESGEFIGLRRSSDFDPVCDEASRYFPERIECGVPMVLEVIVDGPEP